MNDMETDVAFRCLTICLGMVLFVGTMALIAYLLFEAVEAFARGV